MSLLFLKPSIQRYNLSSNHKNIEAGYDFAADVVCLSCKDQTAVLQVVSYHLLPRNTMGATDRKDFTSESDNDETLERV